MVRRLPYLSGLAVLGVVLNHAGAWGQIAAYLWVHRYRPVTSPNWDQLGTLTHYVLLLIRGLGMFAVPAFLFLSGYFAVYASRRSASGLSWNVAGQRVKRLLVPYLIWSVATFVLDAAIGDLHRPGDYLWRILVQGARGPYYYVPLICCLYLISPCMISMIRATRGRGWRLLVACALVLLASVGSRYLHRSGIKSCALDLVVRATPSWSIFYWAFYFAMGMIAASASREISLWLERYRWSLLASAVVLFAVNTIEADVLLQTTRHYWIAFYDTISYHLSATASILCILGLTNIRSPLDRMLSALGRHSYGIYLLHYQAMEVVAKLIYHTLPTFLSYQILLVLLMFACGLGVPLLVMMAAHRSPVRQYYRYMFG